MGGFGGGMFNMFFGGGQQDRTKNYEFKFFENVDLNFTLICT